MTIPILPDKEAKAIVKTAFNMHGACGCNRVTHALASAAHDLLTAEFKALAKSRISGRIRRGVAASVDHVWNSKASANVRLVSAAHWRVTWLAFEAGLLRLGQADSPTYCGTHNMPRNERGGCPSCKLHDPKRPAFMDYTLSSDELQHFKGLFASMPSYGGSASFEWNNDPLKIDKQTPTLADVRDNLDRLRKTLEGISDTSQRAAEEHHQIMSDLAGAGRLFARVTAFAEKVGS